MKKDSLKKLGILGVSFGLMASPLAFAEMEGGTAPQEPAPYDEPQDDQGSFNTYETDENVGTEYEEEEQEYTYEEEEEEQEWGTAEEEDDAQW
ncbi:hypothetical protein [Halomonas dongshanensis]|uniref:Uncharacterized protein n=1 Tax=Halomonas dongshanensis TaxID=2890835 RepID=A0ABT2ECC6_9GAMM|nr:hypothetical protein [Halomonas dongshanensis]MCS2608317.1 hypothetical protein [Halomonas dongshanensis]